MIGEFGEENAAIRAIAGNHLEEAAHRLYTAGRLSLLRVIVGLLLLVLC